MLTEEYMSSEVSESGEESLSGDEGCSKEKKLYIKTVPWESKELKTIKSKLDEEYASRQTSRSRRREFQRDRRPEDVSSRPKPNNGPSWAFRKDDGQWRRQVKPDWKAELLSSIEDTFDAYRIIHFLRILW